MIFVAVAFLFFGIVIPYYLFCGVCRFLFWLTTPKGWKPKQKVTPPETPKQRYDAQLKKIKGLPLTAQESRFLMDEARKQYIRES